MKNLGLYWRTVRHLTLRQMIYQVWHRLCGPARLRPPGTTPTPQFLAAPEADNPVSWQSGAFTFLNLTVSFSTGIDWNYPYHGKLWTYHLTYFEYLNQPTMPVDEGLALIRDFIQQSATVREGLEAYPTSLRIRNWVTFLNRHRVQDAAIDQHLFAQVRLLSDRLEYHLAGNHLLENGFALLTGSLYFRHNRWFRSATRLLGRELTRQILADGGHDERSPVYHQILLDRMLDTLLMIQTPGPFQAGVLHEPGLIRLLTEKSTSMLAWLNAVTFRNGTVPMVNDAAPGLAPDTKQLRGKAIRVLPQTTQPTDPLTDSGYRMFRQNRYELFANVGSVGSNHQPGHAHADTLSFVLNVDNQPVLVDNGTSTYQPGPRRTWERSTAAHNTVILAGTDSSEMWAAFRVGRRARVTLLTDTDAVLTARHDGYRHRGVRHERSWVITPGGIHLTDRLLNRGGNTESRQWGTARFYAHPSLAWQPWGDGIRAGPLSVAFRSVVEPVWQVKEYQMADGFNRLRAGYCLEVYFATRLETTLALIK